MATRGVPFCNGVFPERGSNEGGVGTRAARGYDKVGAEWDALARGGCGEGIDVIIQDELNIIDPDAALEVFAEFVRVRLVQQLVLGVHDGYLLFLQEHSMDTSTTHTRS